MAPKKLLEAERPKRKVVISTIEVKKQIIEKYESGMRLMQLATMFGMPKSTVSNIIKNKEAIKKANVAKGVTTLTSRRSSTIEEMEKRLLVWINNKQMDGDIISGRTICEKAKQLHDELKVHMPRTPNAESETFMGSRGWFAKFRKRIGMHKVLHSETATVEVGGTEVFLQHLKQYIKSEGFVPQQVFICSEIGLCWEKIPNTSYVESEENVVPRQISIKDEVPTLCFCSNASGHCKIKSFLMHHNENPCVFTTYHVIKNTLSIVESSKMEDYVARQFFTEWIHGEFAPSVKAYLTEKNIPLKVLLVMSNVRGHPPGLQEDLVGESNFIKIMFMPPKIASFIQPISYKVTSKLKLHTKAIFERYFEMASATELIVMAFEKNHYSILHFLSTIDQVWMDVRLRTMNSAWRGLWEGSALVQDMNSLEPATLVNEPLSLNKCMGLKVSNEDIEDGPKAEQNTLTVQQNNVAGEFSSEDEEVDNWRISDSEIKELYSVWARTQAIVEKWHPDTTMVKRCIKSFDGDVMPYFRSVHESRKHQVAFERFLTLEYGESESEPSSSNRDIQKNDKVPQEQ